MSKVNLFKHLGFVLCVMVNPQLGHTENSVVENETTTLVIIKGPYLQNVKKDGITFMVTVEAMWSVTQG